MPIGGEVPLTTNDIAIINQRMNSVLGGYNRDLNSIADGISNAYNKQPPDLKRIDQLNKAGKSIVEKAIKELPKEYRNLIGFNQLQPVFDEYGTVINLRSEKIGGVNQKKPGIKLEELTKDQAKNLRKQIKTDALKFEKVGLKDKILSSTGKVLKGVGKVIKPIGYAVGTKALFDAQALAKEKGIELSNFDKLLAIDSGDPNIAINNYMRRNDPKFAAQERAKDLAQMSDDFEEVGQQPMNIDLTMPKFATGGRASFMAGTIPGGYGKQANRYLKEIESDMHRGYQYYKRSGGKKSFKDYMRESMSRYFAGGGIAKEAGDPSGPPPERGPNPQGLPGLLKRVKNI